MLGAVGMVMVLAIGITDLSIFFIARSRAQTAADSTALAAAAELIPIIGEDPAGVAREYAEANGAVLDSCECEMGTDEVEVVVSVPVRMTLSRLSGIRQVTARSRAAIDLDSLTS